MSRSSAQPGRERSPGAGETALRADGGGGADDGLGAERCQTCGDVAVAMVVLGVEPERELAVCADETGRRRSVDVGIVGPVLPGETLLVHAGAALARQVGQR